MILAAMRLLMVMLVLASQTAYSKERIHLRAGLPDFPPFSFVTDDGENKGAVVEYINLLERKTQLDIEIVHMPYARLVKSLASGDIDIGVLFLNDNLANDVRYVAEVSMSKVVVLPRKDIVLNTFDDLYSLSNVAVIRSASFHKQFDTDKMIRKVYVNDYDQGIGLLELGRVDAIVGSISGLDYAMRSIDKAVEDWGKPLKLSDRQWWLHMSNASGNTSLLKSLKSAVDDLYEPYLIYKLYKTELRTSSDFQQLK